MQLYIGNKNYSSWSMRPWVLLRHFGIPFEEVMVRFDSFDAGSTFKQTLQGKSPTGKVPLLVDGDLAVWDTLAIAETLAERFPEHALWPRDAAARARARSVSTAASRPPCRSTRRPCASHPAAARRGAERVRRVLPPADLRLRGAAAASATCGRNRAARARGPWAPAWPAPTTASPGACS